jgi:hypothetical protein
MPAAALVGRVVADDLAELFEAVKDAAELPTVVIGLGAEEGEARIALASLAVQVLGEVEQYPELGIVEAAGLTAGGDHGLDGLPAHDSSPPPAATILGGAATSRLWQPAVRLVPPSALRMLWRGSGAAGHCPGRRLRSSLGGGRIIDLRVEEGGQTGTLLAGQRREAVDKLADVALGRGGLEIAAVVHGQVGLVGMMPGRSG